MLDVFQQIQISQNQQKTSELSREVREGKSTSRDLEERISKLSIVTQAVWSFMKQAYELSDEDLLNRMEEIDLEDGVKDGKITAVVTTCQGCNRKINTIHKTCLYCGAPNHKYSLFSDIS